MTTSEGAMTPGRAAYEAFLPNGPIDWEYADSDVRAMWDAAAQAAIAAAPGIRTAEQVGTIAGTMAVYERDKAASELASLRAHAASLAEDLDDAGATIADYREALTVMQRERDAARAALTVSDAHNGTLRADLASARDSLRTVSRTMVGLARTMEAARIEDAQNGANAGMQWIINDTEWRPADDEFAWDGKESAEAWLERVEAADRDAAASTEGAGA